MSTTKNNSKKEVIATAEIVNLQTALERQLEILNHKKILADNRNLFLTKKENLETFLKEIEEGSKNGDFETPKGKISFIIEASNGYREQERFSVSIPEMVESYVINLLTDIDAAIENIEKQLIEEY